MKKIGIALKWYFYITTSILMVTAVIFGLYGVESLPAETLWQIILSGALTTLLTVVMFYIESKSMAGTILKYFFHYVALSAVMIPLGIWFGWLHADVPGIGMMLICVAAVYLLVVGAYYVVDLQAAKKMNQRLKEKYGE